MSKAEGFLIINSQNAIAAIGGNCLSHLTSAMCFRASFLDIMLNIQFSIHLGKKSCFFKLCSFSILGLFNSLGCPVVAVASF